MIIVCNSCNKKFEINEVLIPQNGRLLQCGVCNNQWFFKKDNQTSIPINTNLQEPDIDDATSKEIIDNDKTIKKESKKNYKKNIDEANYKKNNSRPRFNILNYIIVFIISSIALIILMDTFKSQISLVFPNIEFILYNLYETIKDIVSFLKDLI